MKGINRQVAAIRRIAEEPRLASSGVDPDSPGGAPIWWANPEWEMRFPWLAQGTTGRWPGEGGGDFALFREVGVPVPEERWLELTRALGFSGVAHARQVHGDRIIFHDRPVSELFLGTDSDGHVTTLPDVLLGVTVADCVPVFLVEAQGRGIGLFHAGWRGVAAGILEAGVGLLEDRTGSSREAFHLHLGPAICGDCYEVGLEVHEALGLKRPAGPSPVDLRAILASRALGAGLSFDHITRSSHCTLCGSSPFFSHRGGDPERQMGFLGIRTKAG